MGADRGGSRSRASSFFTASFFTGALNFCEISGFGAVGIGFDAVLNAKLNLPDVPTDCDEADLAAAGRAGPDGANPVDLSAKTCFPAAGPLGGLISLSASCFFGLDEPWSLLLVFVVELGCLPVSSEARRDGADGSELSDLPGLVLDPEFPPRVGSPAPRGPPPRAVPPRASFDE